MERECIQVRLERGSAHTSEVGVGVRIQVRLGGEGVCIQVRLGGEGVCIQVRLERECAYK